METYADWHYRKLAGLKVIVPNTEYELSLKIPKDLLYFEMRIPRLCVSIYLKCENRFAKLDFFADIPFSININLNIGGEKYRLAHGFNVIAL